MQFAEDAKKEKKFAKFCPKTAARTVLLDRRFFEGGAFLQEKTEKRNGNRTGRVNKGVYFIYGSRDDAK